MAERRVKHRYARVSRRMSSDAKVAQLSRPQPCGLSLWRYLLTCRQGGLLPGVICMGPAAIAEANGWTIQQYRIPYAELYRIRLIDADEQAGLLWLPNALKHDPPANGKVVTSWSRWWDEVPECALKTRIYRALRAHMVERQASDDASGKDKKTNWLAVFEQACGTLEDNDFETVYDTVSDTVPDTVCDTVSPRGRARLTGTGTGTGTGEDPPHKPPVGGEVEAKPRSKRKSKTKAQTSLIADDWWPDDKLIEWARGSEAQLTDGQIEKITREFVRYWAARTDGRARKSARGWRAAWQNRVTSWRDQNPNASRYRPPAEIPEEYRRQQPLPDPASITKTIPEMRAEAQAHIDKMLNRGTEVANG